VNSAARWDHIGGNGQGFDRELVEGPFTYSNFPINIEQSPSAALSFTEYDEANYDRNSSEF